MPILQDGWRFIAIFAGVTFLAALTGLAWLFWPLFVLTLWSIYFFRDPPRGVPQDDGCWSRRPTGWCRWWSMPCRRPSSGWASSR